MTTSTSAAWRVCSAVELIRVRAGSGCRRRRRPQRRRRAVGDPQHAGVHQRQQLPGAQRRRPRDQAVDPAADVGVEVQVGVQRQAAVLHHRAHRVTEDAKHLGRRLHRAAAVGDLGLPEVVGEHRRTRRAGNRRWTRYLGWWPKNTASASNGPKRSARPASSSAKRRFVPGARRAARATAAASARAAGLDRQLGVVADVHLREQQRQQFGAHVDLAPTAVQATAQPIERLRVQITGS